MTLLDAQSVTRENGDQNSPSPCQWLFPSMSLRQRQPLGHPACPHRPRPGSLDSRLARNHRTPVTSGRSYRSCPVRNASGSSQSQYNEATRKDEGGRTIAAAAVCLAASASLRAFLSTSLESSSVDASAFAHWAVVSQVSLEPFGRAWIGPSEDMVTKKVESRGLSVIVNKVWLWVKGVNVRPALPPSYL